MASDRVTLSPEFAPPRRGRDREPRRLGGIAGAIGLVVVGLILVSLFRMADEPEAEPFETVVMDDMVSTTKPSDTIEPPGFTAPIPEPAVFASLWEPLDEAVAGFTDTIEMLVTPHPSFDVVLWRASEPLTEVALSVERDGWPMGLDVSGEWFAEAHGFDELRIELRIHPVPGVARPDARPTTVVTEYAVWHPTEPGVLTWLDCSSDGADDARVMTRHVGAAAVEPVVAHVFDEGCGDVSLEYRHPGGFVLTGPDREQPQHMTLGAARIMTAINRDLGWIADGPDGVALWAPADRDGIPTMPALVWANGRQPAPVPGLADGEQLLDAVFSPEGRFLAMRLHPSGAESLLRVVEMDSGEALTELTGLHEEYTTAAWSTDGRFLVYSSHGDTADTGVLGFYDPERDSTTEVEIAEVADEIRLHEAPRPWWPGIDPSEVAAADVAPAGDENQVLPTAGGGSLDADAPRLPLGVRAALPDAARLDFLATSCFDRCFRDAVMVDEHNPEGSGTWTAGVPFHVRHGFVNEGPEPLSDAFEVAVYITRRSGPELEDGTYELDHTYRFASDYVVRGLDAECGPGYWDQEGVYDCEWFVHEFPDGLPPGRYDLWATWIAPCSTWRDLGLLDSCDDPSRVSSEFAGAVNMPFDGEYGNW